MLYPNSPTSSFMQKVGLAGTDTTTDTTAHTINSLDSIAGRANGRASGAVKRTQHR
jgi:hypothetical protein